VLACGMPLRFAACLPVAAALLALPGAAEAANVVRPSSITDRTVVPAGEAVTVRLSCAAPSVALSGAVTRQGAGVTVRRSTPGAGAGDWSFRLAAAAGAQSRAVTMVLRCVRLEVPSGISGARLVVRTRMRPGVTVPAGGSTEIRLQCGRAGTATGYGLDRGARDDLVLTAVVPEAHGWRFRLENTGSTPATAGVSARCLRTNVRASGGELTFGVTRPSFAASFAAGEGRRTAFRNCGRSRFSLAAGVTVDPADSIEFVTGGPTRTRGNRWSFRNVTNGDGFRAVMVCLRTGSGFH
jgi:hypothetical protein